MSTTGHTRFCLIRHGETAWNKERRLQGHTDIPLNEQGLEQARQLGISLRHRELPFTALYSSDLQRTRQTAAPLVSLTGLAPRLQPALRERHYGCLQGKTYAEAEQHLPMVFAQYRARKPDFVLDGGESLRQFQQRIQTCLETLAAEHHGQSILVITHGGVLDIMYRLATGMALDTPRDFPINNATLNWLDYHNGQWSIAKWGDNTHLQHTLDELQ